MRYGSTHGQKMQLADPPSNIWAARTVWCSICHYARGGWESAVERLNIQIKPSTASDFLSTFLSHSRSKKIRFSVWKIFTSTSMTIFGSHPYHLEHLIFFIRKAAIRASNKKIIMQQAVLRWQHTCGEEIWLEIPAWAREKNLTPNKWSVVVNLLSCQGKDFSVSPTEPSSALFSSGVQHPLPARGFSLFSPDSLLLLSAEREREPDHMHKEGEVVFLTMLPHLGQRNGIGRCWCVCFQINWGLLLLWAQACNHLTCNLRIKSSRALLFYSFNFNVQQIKCLLHSFIVLFPRFAPRKGGGGPLKALAPTIIKLERQLK